MRNIFDLTRKEFEDYFLSIGEKKFKALQVYEWLYQKREFDIDNFSNIKKEIRDKLKNSFSNHFITIETKEEDVDTKKYLFRLEDNNFIEAVVMHHEYGN